MARARPLRRVAAAANSVNAAANAGRRTANEATYLIRELMDGFRLVLVRNPDEGTVMDFVMGKIDRLPLECKIEVKEEG